MFEPGELKYDSIVVHYGEITLKRGKRGSFERSLQANLERFTGLPVKRLQGRFIINLSHETQLESILEKVGRVFGVVWYAPAVRASSLDELQEKLLRILEGIKPRSLKVETRRSDKSFPMTSLEISRRLGLFLSSRLGAKVDLKSPERRVFVEVTEDGIYASLMKLRGPGGLPLGSSGKVLGLFSGGAKSALACWLMMKRGCRVDLLHIHRMNSGGGGLKTYLKLNVSKLLEYSLRLKIYLASSKQFLDHLGEISADNVSQLLQIFMLKLGEAVAERKGYLGLVLGASIEKPSQASNLSAILSFRSLPAYMPLLALNHEKVREKIKELGFAEVSADYSDLLRYFERYRDESSRIDLKILKRLWKKCGLDDAVNHSLENLEIYELRLGREPRKIR